MPHTAFWQPATEARATHVRRRLGGAGEGVIDVCLGTDPCRFDFVSRPKDVDAGAVIGEEGAVVRDGGGTHSDGVLRVSGRCVAGVQAVVTGCDDRQNAAIVCALQSRIYGIILLRCLRECTQHETGVYASVRARQYHHRCNQTSADVRRRGRARRCNSRCNH